MLMRRIKLRSKKLTLVERLCGIIPLNGQERLGSRTYVKGVLCWEHGRVIYSTTRNGAAVGSL